MGASDSTQIIPLEPLENVISDDEIQYLDIDQVLLSDLFGLRNVKAAKWDAIYDRQKEILSKI